MTVERNEENGILETYMVKGKGKVSGVVFVYDQGIKNMSNVLTLGIFGERKYNNGTEPVKKYRCNLPDSVF